MTLPSWRRRTFRALGFITVCPIDTWPSPMMTTLSSLRAEGMVVPCQGAALCAWGLVMRRDMGDGSSRRKGCWGEEGAQKLKIIARRCEGLANLQLIAFFVFPALQLCSVFSDFLEGFGVRDSRKKFLNISII